MTKRLTKLLAVLGAASLVTGCASLSRTNDHLRGYTPREYSASGQNVANESLRMVYSFPRAVDGLVHTSGFDGPFEKIKIYDSSNTNSPAYLPEREYVGKGVSGKIKYHAISPIRGVRDVLSSFWEFFSGVYGLATQTTHLLTKEVPVLREASSYTFHTLDPDNCGTSGLNYLFDRLDFLGGVRYADSMRKDREKDMFLNGKLNGFEVAFETIPGANYFDQPDPFLIDLSHATGEVLWFLFDPTSFQNNGSSGGNGGNSGGNFSGGHRNSMGGK